MQGRIYIITEEDHPLTRGVFLTLGDALNAIDLTNAAVYDIFEYQVGVMQEYTALYFARVCDGRLRVEIEMVLHNPT